MIKRKSYFTLVEIVMAMALLVLIVGAVTFNIRSIIGQQKFQNEVGVVTDILNRAQQLMVIYNKPMKVKFSIVQDAGIKCYIESDCLLNPLWEKWTIRHSTVLTEIHALNFSDAHYHASSGEERTVYFLPNGGNISKGTIELSSVKSSKTKGSYNAYICLPGYPKIVRALEAPLKDCEEPLAPYIGLSTKTEVMERAVHFE